VPWFLLSITAYIGIPDALSASAPAQTPIPGLPFSASNPLPLEIPAGRAVPYVPAGSPLNPNSTPVPAPAPTNHYAGSAENDTAYD